MQGETRASYRYSHIWVENADGTGRTQLTFTPDADRSPTWTPAGQRFTVTSQAEQFHTSLYTVNADGSGTTQLIPPETDMAAWSPDGSMLAYGRRTGQGLFTIYIANADGSGETKFCCDDTARA